MDLQDLCMSARSATSDPLLAIEMQLGWYERVQEQEMQPNRLGIVIPASTY